jgi:hypothetical protein
MNVSPVPMSRKSGKSQPPKGGSALSIAITQSSLRGHQLFRLHRRPRRLRTRGGLP